MYFIVIRHFFSVCCFLPLAGYRRLREKTVHGVGRLGKILEKEEDEIAVMTPYAARFRACPESCPAGRQRDKAVHLLYPLKSRVSGVGVQDRPWMLTWSRENRGEVWKERGRRAS